MPLIFVCGAVANKLHQGGEAWVRLSYVLGLRRLGFQVHLLEQIDPSTCVHPDGRPSPLNGSANKAYFDDTMRAFGLSDCCTLLSSGEDAAETILPELVDLAASADALLNISGHLSLEPLLSRFRRKVFIDIDPGFTQFWQASGEARLRTHDCYFTIGENIGRPACQVPVCGINWQITRPPVVLDLWPLTTSPPLPARFTTIANWRGSYGPVEFGGKTYGLKVHEFRKMLPLPSARSEVFEIALNIHPGDQRDRDALVSAGWQLVDPHNAASKPERFQRYVQGSGAEFSVAQGMYTQTRSGWFSDRTVRYLASGRPALVQETGFSEHLPTGRGLLRFETFDQAIDGVEQIASNYEEHCAAARSIAEQFFDSNKVLGRLMEEIGVAAP